MNRLRVLIVGCGNIAGGFDAARSLDQPPLTHAGAYFGNAGFDVVACVEPDQARRNAFMARWHIPLGFATMTDAANAMSRIDVISICSPTNAHAQDLEAALALSPRAIFCEKPVTPTLAETELWVAQCAKAGVLLAVNHTRRWAPDVVRLQAQLADGQWGVLRSITGWYNKGILNNGGHLVDLTRMLAGDLTVLAVGTPIYDFWPDDPTIPALLETRHGVPVQLCTAHAGDYAMFELQLVTEKAVIIMENGGMSWRCREAVDSAQFKGHKNLATPQTKVGEYAVAMGHAVNNLFAACHGTETLASNGESALEAQRICEKIYQAAQLRVSPF